MICDKNKNRTIIRKKAMNLQSLRNLSLFAVKNNGFNLTARFAENS